MADCEPNASPDSGTDAEARRSRADRVFDHAAETDEVHADAGSRGSGLVGSRDDIDAAALGAGVVEHGPDMMLLLDGRGRIVAANAKCGLALGVRTGDLIGLYFADILHASDSGDLPDDPRDLVDFRQFEDHPWEVRLRSARDHWQLVSGAAVDLTDDPRVGAVLLSLRPVGGPGEVIASRALLLAAMDAANSSIVVADVRQEDSPLVYVNRGFCQMAGYDRGEMLGENCRFLQYPPGESRGPIDRVRDGRRDDGTVAELDEDGHDQRAAIETIAGGVRDGTYVNAVLRNYKRDGTKFYNDLYLTPVVENGQYLGVIGVQNDVSDRVEAERELRQRERTLRGLFDAAPMMMGVVELVEEGDGEAVVRHVTANAAACEMLGCDGDRDGDRGGGDAVRDRTLGDFGFGDGVVRQWRRAMAAAVAGGGPVRFQCVVPDRADQAGRNLRVSVQLIEAAHGREPPRLCYVAEDTTAGDKAEADRFLLESAIENSNEAAVITSPDLDPPGPKILYVNRAFEEMTGWSRDEVIGKTPRVLQGDKTDRGVLDRLRRDLETKRHFRGESVNYRKDGGEFTIDWSIAPILDTGGNVAYWVAGQRDVTRRRELERQVLTIQQREQERFARDLHDTVAQQLNALTIYVGTVARELEMARTADREQVGMLRDAVAQARQAAETARNISHSLMPVELNEGGLMEALRRLAERSQKSYGVACRFVCEPPVPVPDHEQASHLYRIAAEAVGNALRHGRPGRVTITLHCDGDSDAFVSVADDGRGLAGLAGDRASDRAGGLGMSTMRYRAELIGGSLTVAPGDAGGTVVTCRFPLDTTAPSPP